MLVTFKNTGMVEEADIRFDGLTVIAGENDTGKSTIGKLMFSIIKTFNRYERDARQYQLGRVENSIEDYYSNYRQKYSDSPVVKEIKTFFDELKIEALKLMENTLEKNKIRSIISQKIKGFAEIIQTVSGAEINLEEIPNRIADLIDKKPPKEEVFKRSFSKYMTSVLWGEVINKFVRDKEYSIVGEEGENSIFDISGTNGTVKLRLLDKLYYQDATFVESPILLNLADTIRFSKSEFDMEGETKKRVELLEKAYTPEYMKDLILKLTDHTTKGKSSKIADHLRDIMGGEFYYDPEERDFVFSKGNKTFKGVSIAAGIKYLGVVNILSLAGFISKKTLLVIDEPETHMHPQWQIRFAEVIIELVKEGNYILLTSHSPYFIEAVKIHSDKSQLKENTAFYLSEKNRTGLTSRIIEVTDDVSPIFELLSEPYDKLETLHSMDDG